MRAEIVEATSQVFAPLSPAAITIDLEPLRQSILGLSTERRSSKTQKALEIYDALAIAAREREQFENRLKNNESTSVSPLITGPAAKVYRTPNAEMKVPEVSGPKRSWKVDELAKKGDRQLRVDHYDQGIKKQWEFRAKQLQNIIAQREAQLANMP